MPEPRRDGGSPIPTTNRDATTIALLVGGDPEGLRNLLADHGGCVHHRLTRLFNRALDAHEIGEAMNLAVTRVWRTPGRFDRRHGTLRAWLFVIARNCALRLISERRRLALVSIDDLEQILVQLVEGQNDRDRLRRIADVHGCLRELPALQRAVLLADLQADGTASAAGLAAQLATTIRAIHSARSSGRSELRRMMQRLGHFPGLGLPDPGADRRPQPRIEPEFG